MVARRVANGRRAGHSLRAEAGFSKVRLVESDRRAGNVQFIQSLWRSERARNHLPPRSVNLRRALRAQRLAAGIAEAADQTHLGQCDRDQPRDSETIWSELQACLARRRTRPGGG